MREGLGTSLLFPWLSMASAAVVVCGGCDPATPHAAQKSESVDAATDRILLMVGSGGSTACGTAGHTAGADSGEAVGGAVVSGGAPGGGGSPGFVDGGAGASYVDAGRASDAGAAGAAAGRGGGGASSAGGGGGGGSGNAGSRSLNRGGSAGALATGTAGAAGALGVGAGTAGSGGLSPAVGGAGGSAGGAGGSSGGGGAGERGGAGPGGGAGLSGGGGTGLDPGPLPQPGELAIVELLINPAGTDTGREWIEVVNRSPHALDLGSLHVADAANDAPVDFSAVGRTSLAAGGRAVLIQSADATKNGGVVLGPATFGGSFGTRVSLNNDADTIAICIGACSAGVTIDHYVWDASLGAAYDAHAVSIDDAGRACPATTPFGDAGSFGTPGAANPPCP